MDLATILRWIAVPEQPCSFAEIVTEIATADALREKARSQAFDSFERHATTLASMALQVLGDRNRAMNWMCYRQRHLGGKSAYEALAEGDVDRVWDLMIGLCNEEWSIRAL
jgi:hypothetical protein